MKNERGLTLIELLAVIVILGIIIAIAIPAIGGVIGKTKADVHLANARIVLNSAKLAYVSGYTPRDISGEIGFTTMGYTMKELSDNGYIQGKVKNPSVFSWTTSKANTADVYNEERSFILVVPNGGKQDFKVNLNIDPSSNSTDFIFRESATLNNITRENLTSCIRIKLNINTPGEVCND